MTTLGEIARNVEGLSARLLQINIGDADTVKDLHAARDVFRQRGKAAIDALVNAIDDGIKGCEDEMAAADAEFKAAIDDSAAERRAHLATALALDWTMDPAAPSAGAGVASEQAEVPEAEKAPDDGTVAAQDEAA